MRLTIRAAVILLLLATFFNFDSAEARRHRRRHSKVKRAVINEPSLWDRLGGPKGVSDLADQWLKLNLADQRLNLLFAEVAGKPDRIMVWRKKLSEQICELADGPCVRRESMTPISPEVATIDERFLIYADNLYSAMVKLGVKEREKNELLGALGEVRAEQVAPAQEAEPAATPGSAVLPNAKPPGIRDVIVSHQHERILFCKK